MAHVDPSQTTRSEKGGKMRRAQNTVKRGSFWRPGVSAAGAAAPLSYGEERNAFGKDTARGPLAGLMKGCRPCCRPRACMSIQTQRSLKRICTCFPGCGCAAANNGMPVCTEAFAAAGLQGLTREQVAAELKPVGHGVQKENNI